MVLHRDFETAAAEQVGEQPTFSFRGMDFTCVPLGQVPFGIVDDMLAALSIRADDGDHRAELQATVATMRFFNAVLVDESAERMELVLVRKWDEHLLADDAEVPPGWVLEERPGVADAEGKAPMERWAVWYVVKSPELQPLTRWLMECYLGRPTRRSSEFSDPSSPTGPNSRATASSPDSAPTNGHVPDLAAAAARHRAEHPGELEAWEAEQAALRASSTGPPDSSSPSPSPGS